MIFETQQKIIDLATKRLKSQINDLKLNIIKAKEKINDENIEKIYDQINREEKNDFDNAHEKVSRIIARPFIASTTKKRIYLEPKLIQIKVHLIPLTFLMN
ncbi:hypothetical protein BpHYR1_018056 [Brachionus plicatilis]|uniref:Uncharacterized protein n=1 Tax=Brachionus plicatilis TaxID=10195 RepID=A0A3M7S3N7_BRAPC|nr:hypothetical protein BpHYR1_018056 [Brachionus plicatilis]